MKKLVVGLVSAAALATLTAGMAAATNSMNANQSSNNNAAGIYVSGNVGYGRVDLKNSDFSSSELSGFAWNVGAGYQFNSYFALEMNYNDYTTPSESANYFGIPENLKLQTYSMDLLMKGIYPINDQFNVFAKAGAAYMNYEGIDSVSYDGLSQSVSSTTTRIVPEFGIGAGYNVTQNVALTIQGLTTLAGSNGAPATYTGLVGASYKFNM